MPVVESHIHPSLALLEDHQEQLRQDVRAVLTKSLQECPQLELPQVDEAEIEAEIQRQKESCACEYQRMVEATKDTLLSKLCLSTAGCMLFEELCLRIDINQQYASCLPQWKDVAHLLEVDALRTQWVQACVRPAEGLTKAILEIYMRDGGTLGEVLQALLQLQCLEILEKIKPKVWSYLEGSSCDKEQGKFFSVLSTLASILGKEDPCQLVQRYSGGLLPKGCRQEIISSPLSHSVLVRSSGDGEGITCDPNLDCFKASPIYKHPWDNEKKSGLQPKLCRILLLFAQDGIEAANKVCKEYQGFEFEGTKAEFFRLNETSLWYEVLVNMEACCMKWANEVDYVMPILTPTFLSEVHSSGAAEDGFSGLLPTSPLINRFLYTLLRARYTEANCRNTVVRPIIPEEHLSQVGQAKAVKLDPLFRNVWVLLVNKKMEKRLQGMLAHTH